MIGLVHFAQALHCVDVLHHSPIANIAKIANIEFSGSSDAHPRPAFSGRSNGSRPTN
jgi:hypothetical protein